jgi:hypothetical protein
MIESETQHETQDVEIVYIGLHKIQGGFILYCWELMKSVGSHGNSSLLLVMKKAMVSDIL